MMRFNDARLSAYEASIDVFMGIFHGIIGFIPVVSLSSLAKGTDVSLFDMDNIMEWVKL